MTLNMNRIIGLMLGAVALMAGGCSKATEATVEASVDGVGTQSLHVVSRGVRSATATVQAVTAVDNAFTFAVPCTDEPVLVQVFTSKKLPLATFMAEPGDNVRLGSGGFVTGGQITKEFADALATLPGDALDPAADNQPVSDYVMAHRGSAVAAALMAARLDVRANPALASELMAVADTATWRLARLPLVADTVAPFTALLLKADTLTTVEPGGVMLFTGAAAPRADASLRDSVEAWSVAGLTITRVWLGADTAAWHRALEADTLSRVAPGLVDVATPLPPVPCPLVSLPQALLTGSAGAVSRRVPF